MVLKQFMTVKELSQEFTRSVPTVNNMVKGIKNHPDRYDPETTFFGDGAKKLVRTAAVIDYENNKQILESGYAEAYIPAYDPLKYESELGITHRYPTAKEIAKEVAVLLVRQ